MVVQKQNLNKYAFAINYLDWAPRVQEFIDKVRKRHFDRTVVEPVAWMMAFLLLVGLLWFIYYVDRTTRMPESPPDEQEGKLDDEDYDFNDLVKKQQESDESFILRGSTEKYNWQQSMSEVDVFIPLPDESQLPRKDIKVTFKTGKLAVVLAGNPYIDGVLFDEIMPDECNWQIDIESSGDSDNVVTSRRLWINMLKKKPTSKNQCWRALLLGDKEVNPGPPVVALDPTNTSSLKQAIDAVRKNATSKSKTN
jgi:hypothetical protein